jgi:putative transposase
VSRCAAAVTAAQIASATGKTIRAINKRAQKQGWQHETSHGNGTIKKQYALSCLPADIQKCMVERMENIADVITNDIPVLCPEAALAVSSRIAGADLPGTHTGISSFASDTVLSEKTLRDPRVRRIANMVQDALCVPSGIKKSKWIRMTAQKHDIHHTTLYKYIKRYQKQGLAGLMHVKKNRGKPRAWDDEALDYWIGLCLKREHRKIAKDALYNILAAEAEKRGWRIGSYESALGWYNEKVTPQLLALQRGGVRALDNVLPPVLRSYADLAPFEILVGDQHRFDFWVMDDNTGEIFRPEAFFWQDLRTRCFYGAAVDKKYDSQLVGLALRMGCHIFGALTAIYTDNGKPELSRYIMGILSAIRSLGMRAERTLDADLEVSQDPELVNPCAILPGTHKKAIVRNAKAKMIEGSFNIFEGILRDHFHVPGYAKRLTDLGEWQEIDQKEMEGLARAGKLLTFSEFALIMYQAIDYYNSKKQHRGALREWIWRPKPKQCTPLDVLRACYVEGWRPRRLHPDEIDLVFLARADRGGRVVDQGRISFRNMFYEHDALDALHKTRIQVLYDPMDPEWVLCFHQGRFICRAVPIEWSSMKDKDLAGRKIHEKRTKRRAVLDAYREITKNIPSFLRMSEIPAHERPDAIMGTPKQRRKILDSRAPVQTADEIAEDIRQIETYRCENKPIFSSPVDRYQWLVDRVAEVEGRISVEDEAFMREFEAEMDADTRRYWEIYRESVGDCMDEGRNTAP